MEEVRKYMTKLSQIIGRTAGVLDPNGRIVASTTPALVGEEDVAGVSANVTTETIASTSSRSYIRLEPVEQGEFIAFIDGADETSQTYLNLIRLWLNAAFNERNAAAEVRSFLKNVLLENELPGDIPLKAREYKIEYAVPRQAFLVRINNVAEINVPERLRQLYPETDDHYVLPMDEESIVVLVELDAQIMEKDHSERRQIISDMAEDMLKSLSGDDPSSIHIGVGMQAETLKDTAKSYREASLALTVGDIFENDTNIMRYDKLGLGRLIYQLPPTLCRMFLSEVFEPGAYEALDDETLLTIHKFFENNLNGSETSRQLFVHRNTLVYRLDKVQKITALDLRNFDDAVMFKLASMVRKYLEKQDQNLIRSSSGW